MNLAASIFGAAIERFLSMKTIRFLLFSFIVILLFTSQVCFQEQMPGQFFATKQLEKRTDTLLYQRFSPPSGFTRVAADSSSFPPCLVFPRRPEASGCLLTKRTAE
jgi:hypothetical protein